MTTSEPPPLTVVQPGGGRVGELGDIGVHFKLWGEDTGGAMAIVAAAENNPAKDVARRKIVCIELFMSLLLV